MCLPQPLCARRYIYVQWFFCIYVTDVYMCVSCLLLPLYMFFAAMCYPRRCFFLRFYFYFCFSLFRLYLHIYLYYQHMLFIYLRGYLYLRLDLYVCLYHFIEFWFFLPFFPSTNRSVGFSARLPVRPKSFSRLLTNMCTCMSVSCYVAISICVSFCNIFII